tara:strand:+ start:1105 stop:1317 length:213 start_codon:yes stop_codon:yes gene_type:complete
MEITLEHLNITLEKELKDFESFKKDPESEDLEDGIATFQYEISKTRSLILEHIAHNDSEKEIALKLLTQI